ncbi:MAG: DUF167 domain-containing protein [Candidatus Omnitrophica bacterium]|nr:DUF167 domain-containing protein [Candidatus Omnitrophota bacterium]
MNISVKVKPQAKEDKVKRIGLDNYVVWVKAKAVEGKANQAVIKVLSEYFDIAKSKLVLIKGKRTRDKIFMVNI